MSVLAKIRKIKAYILSVLLDNFRFEKIHHFLSNELVIIIAVAL